MNKITTQIRLLVITLTTLMLIGISATIAVNNHSEQDAFVINIAGKERMFTQQIAKEVFALFSANNSNYNALNRASYHFETNLNDLIIGNDIREIYAAPTPMIKELLNHIAMDYSPFSEAVEQFKISLSQPNTTTKEMMSILHTVSRLNTQLLAKFDHTVYQYTLYAKNRQSTLHKIQLSIGFLAILITLYALVILKTITSQFKTFSTKFNQIATYDDDSVKQNCDYQKNEPIVASSNFDHFIQKIGGVIANANTAILAAEEAAKELNTLSENIEHELDNAENEKLESYLDKSEDIAIQSVEELHSTSQMLQKLQENLDKLAQNK